MKTIRAGVPTAADPAAARALWYDTRRWPAFLDGFRTVVRQDPEWPDGGVLIWDSTSAGQGRTREVVTGPDVQEVETEDFRGRRTVDFADDGVRVSFEYELKKRTLVTPLLDRFFVRGQLRDSLQRTLDRFAIELRDEG